MSRFDQLVSRRVLTLVLVVAVIVAGVAVVLATRGSDPSQPPQEQGDPHVREELLDELEPNPECPDGESGPEIGAGQTRLNVARVVDGCLTFTSVVVEDADVDDRLADLRAEPDVVAVDRAVRYEPGGAPGHGLRTELDDEDQWPLEERHLNGNAMHDLWPQDSSEVWVAIVDTGIDVRNPDLRDQVAVTAPWSTVYDDEDEKYTFESHGTEVAGIVAAADDDEGVVGLTPKVKLMDVQYYGEQQEKAFEPRDEGYAGPANDLGDYVRWSVDHGADVVNMSIHGEYSATLAAALAYAEQAGVVVVGIAGNCGAEDFSPCASRNEVRWPAGAETALSVASHDDHDEHAESSSANASVDITAPGVEIRSDCLGGDDGDRKTCTDSGTSLAAPYVSATAALLRARQPESPPSAIRDAILATARPTGGQGKGYRSDEYGYGILEPVDAAAYLDEHPGIDADGGGGDAPDDDTVVGAYLAVSGGGESDTLQLATAGGESIPVQGVVPGPYAPRMAFSADGAYFAATDGEHLTVMDLEGGAAQTLDCRCLGVAFDPEGYAVTAEGATLHRFDPAKGEKVDDIEIKHDDDGLLMQRVLAATPSLIYVGASYDEFGEPLETFAVDSSGEVTDVPDFNLRGVGLVATSEDGRWLAYGSQGQGCLAEDPEIVVVDLDESRNGEAEPARLALPTRDVPFATLTDLQFEGAELIVGVAAHDSAGGCGAPREPALWSAPIPGPEDEPPVWHQVAAERGFERTASNGDQLFTTVVVGSDGEIQPDRMALWFDPASTSDDPVKIADFVTEVVARPR